jgi:DNA-binding NtrC family response regulator
MHITTAQALLRCGQAGEAARRLLAASRLGVTTLRELQGAFYFAASEVSADHGLAEQLAKRADRLWATQGIVAVKLEMESERPPGVSDRTVATLADERAVAFEAMAGAIDMAANPRLLGHELLAALQALGISDAEIVETHATSPQPKANAERVVMALGRHHGSQLHLVCRVPDDGDKVLRLASILRIGQAALDAEKHHAEQRAKAALWPADEFEVEGGGIFISEEMRGLLTLARKVAPLALPVLITGETGTGKEVLARIVHATSERAKGLFVPFNCASFPREMLDSQLFGHRKGAFTGAIEHSPGVIRAAAGGTLFLDEIGDMGLDVQPKLLRFLESGEVHPVGEAHPVRTDVRVVAATNVDLNALVAQGRFRQDLLYRLDIVRLPIPPLRDRSIEIPALANYHLQKYSREMGKADLRLSEEAMEYLTLYRWPGNVRQLANAMRRLVALAESGAVLTPQYLDPEVLASRRTIPASERQLDPSEMVISLNQPLATATEQLERRMIEHALRKCNGRIDETAAMLGLSRKGLYLKRHRFGIELPSAAEAVGAPHRSSSAR